MNRIKHRCILLGVVIAFALFASTMQAQSHREVFQRFPFKRPEASITPSKTNLVTYNADEGYLSIQIREEANMAIDVNFVLFKADDGTKYYAYQEIVETANAACKRAFLKFYVQDDGEWRDVTGQLLPSVRISEFYGQKSTPNLVDVGGIISYTPDDNKRGVGLGIDYTLPKKGTSIQATLANRCEAAVQADYKKLYDECKFKTIELLWNKQNGWFLMGKKK